MVATGKFSAETVETLGKRAALHCSNPDCGVLTAGPTSEVDSSINIGEAAHIYGRTDGSARYVPQMSAAERADITNGVWLCRNCHKEVDNDPERFPAELLFEWRRQHEHAVIDRIGKKGEFFRDKLKSDRLKAFESASYLAQQIVLDHPKHWELKLTAELLRSELGAVDAEWQQLNEGLYVRKSTLISIDDLANWMNAKFDDVSRILAAFERLISLKLSKAMGDLGVPGNDIEILRICRLIVAAARNLLAWEEDIRFTSVPKEFDGLLRTLQGVAGTQLNEMMRIPVELSKILEMDDPKGIFHVNLVFKLPDTFVSDFRLSLEACYQNYRRQHFT